LSGDETLAEVINEKQVYVSFVTELELLSYSKLEEEEEQKIKSFLKECGIVNITEQVKERTISIKRKYKLKLPDSIIAATSEYLDIPLITADADFKKVEDINVIHYNINENPAPDTNDVLGG
jgi:predicted nucleic acid-binding protein